MTESKQIQHVIQIYTFSDMQVIFRLCHIIKEKFQNQGAAKSPTFNFKIGKSHWQVDIFYIVYSDKPRICHCLRKTIAVICIRSNAGMVRTVFSKIFATDNFVTKFPVLTTNKAAFIA